MEFILKLYRAYFKILSSISPDLAARSAINLFQKPRQLKRKKREQKFYDNATSHTIIWNDDVITYFSKGDAKNPLVILSHGWESNAGSMGGIADLLVDQGYYCIILEHPAHGVNMQKKTNIILAENAYQTVLKDLNPQKPFSVIGHSFGSAVSSLTFSQNNYELDHLILLASPNKIKDIFYDYKRIIGLPDKAYSKMLKIIQKEFKGGKEILEMSVADSVNRINIKKLTLIHDRKDKIVPIISSVDIKNNAQMPSELIDLERLGHYRMLWNDEVFTHVLGVLQTEPLGHEDLLEKNNELIS
jgi:pimeloyl-ACP methyl ester carboxylesterase